MGFKDVLLALTTYRDPTPVEAVNEAVRCAAALGARISAFACEVEIRAPRSVLSDVLLDVPALVEAEEKKSRDSARDLLAAFREAAGGAGIFDEVILERARASDVPEVLLEHARVRDLTIVPVPEGDFVDQWYAESLIFGSGRPVMVIPQSRPRGVRAFDTVVVAWDFSRPAARALADAMPVLRQAQRVHVVTVTNEKAGAPGRLRDGVFKNLAKHGVSAVLDEIDAAGRGIGAALAGHVEATNADLLVMGAYGHSRVRQFILGGATRSILSRPPLAVLMSH